MEKPIESSFFSLLKNLLPVIYKNISLLSMVRNSGLQRALPGSFDSLIKTSPAFRSYRKSDKVTFAFVAG
jgi:hypothetical protein